MKLSSAQFREILGNKIATVSFIKKDGTLRTLTGRLDVVSHLHGGQDSTEHMPEYVNVFEMSKQQYRKVNMNTVQSIRANGKEYLV